MEISINSLGEGEVMDIRIMFEDKPYLIKEGISEGCSLRPSPSRVCTNVRLYVESFIGDSNETCCGLDQYVLVEDTPKQILNYLDAKINPKFERVEVEDE